MLRLSRSSQPNVGDPMFLLAADALKRTCRDTGSTEHLQAFLALRQWIARQHGR